MQLGPQLNPQQLRTRPNGSKLNRSSVHSTRQAHAPCQPAHLQVAPSIWQATLGHVTAPVTADAATLAMLAAPPFMFREIVDQSPSMTMTARQMTLISAQSMAPATSICHTTLAQIVPVSTSYQATKNWTKRRISR